MGDGCASCGCVRGAAADSPARARAGHAAEVHALARAMDTASGAMQKDMQSMLALRFQAADMCSKYVATMPDATTAPGVYVPGFPPFSEDLINITHAGTGVWVALLTDAQRPAFEAAALEAARAMDPSGALAAQVQRDGIRVRLPNNTYARAPRLPFYAARWNSAPREPSAVPVHLLDLYADPLRRVRAGGAMRYPFIACSCADATRDAFPFHGSRHLTACWRPTRLQ